EERAKQLKELKSRSSYPLHPDRRFVKAEISLLLLDKTTTPTSTASPQHSSPSNALTSTSFS
ncbi:Uncharacterized protein FKW44_000448, partial [Caligus rogercresseyi]